MTINWDHIMVVSVILCGLSALLFAFTGQTLWVTTKGTFDPRDALLVLIHACGVLIPLFYFLIKDCK